ncbi:DUF4012 domain-containing protein [Patescibacteria group bacterium]|nr:DUF4012 domain-containing protein [Patescibacteria group bacterium]
MAKKIVPKKNIEPVLVDVKKPNFNYEHLEKFEKIDLTKIPQKKKSRFSVFKKTVLVIFLIGLVGVLSFVGITFANLRQMKDMVSKSGSEIVRNFSSSVGALKNFEPQTASTYLEENTKSLANINDLIQKGIGQTVFDTVSNFIPIVKEAFGLVGQVSNLNMKFLDLTNAVGDLEKNGFQYFRNDGKSLIADLEKIHDSIQYLNSQAENIKNTTSYLKSMSSFFGNLDTSVGNDYLKYSSELYGLDNVLSSLINLLNSSTPKHIVILFQNPAEIRPGGGFIGSYADITIQNGQMQNMDVRDIYDPDGQLALNIVPPEELQATTPNWGARDSNWFFDFPTSAKTAINFLDASKMYSDKNIRFDALIGININVVNSLLDITGPIDVPGYMTVNSSNFLEEVQKETESGSDKAAGQPKKILQVLAPILMEKLSSLSSDQKTSLINALKTRLDKKDIMFYSTDPVIENYLDSADLNGAVYNLPDGFWGSYLAVVNANVAGGKSDAFVSENVNAKVDMDVNGNTFTNLGITRTHTGNTQKDSWWKATNNDFIQIFTEPNSTLVDIEGNDIRKKYNTLDYANSTYAINPDLAAIQSNEVFLSNFNTWQRSEFGKNVYGTWLMTKAGTTRTLTVRYQSHYNSKILMPGQKYTFIFEKQSGVDASLDLTINAPFKYYWLESNSPVFTYHSDDPDKRTIITLTLGYQSE